MPTYYANSFSHSLEGIITEGVDRNGNVIRLEFQSSITSKEMADAVLEILRARPFTTTLSIDPTTFLPQIAKAMTGITSLIIKDNINSSILDVVDVLNRGVCVTFEFDATPTPRDFKRMCEIFARNGTLESFIFDTKTRHALNTNFLIPLLRLPSLKTLRIVGFIYTPEFVAELRTNTTLTSLKIGPPPNTNSDGSALVPVLELFASNVNTGIRQLVLVDMSDDMLDYLYANTTLEKIHISIKNPTLQISDRIAVLKDRLGIVNIEVTSKTDPRVLTKHFTISRVLKITENSNALDYLPLAYRGTLHIKNTHMTPKFIKAMRDNAFINLNGLVFEDSLSADVASLFIVNYTVTAIRIKGNVDPVIFKTFCQSTKLNKKIESVTLHIPYTEENLRSIALLLHEDSPVRKLKVEPFHTSV